MHTFYRYKIAKKAILTTVFFMMVLLVVGNQLSSAAVASDTEVLLNGKPLGIHPTVSKGNTFIAVRELSQSLNCKVLWDATSRSITTLSPTGKAVFKLNSRHMRLNEVTSSLVASPYIKGGQVYIPLRSIAIALGYELNWQKNRIDLQGDDSLIQSSYGDTTAWISYQQRKLYISKSNSKPLQIDDQLPKFKGNKGTALLQIRPISGSIFVSIHDNYGEPSIHDDYHQYLIQGSKVVRKITTAYVSTKSTQTLMNTDKDAVMIDGTRVLLVQPSGNIRLEYNMVALMKIEEPFTVEAVYDDLIVMKLSRSAILVGYHVNNHTATEFYKKLLSPEEQKKLEESDPMDIQNSGDRLKWVKRVANIIYLERLGHTYELSL
ncbi:hypothetical protein J2Z69_001649 [Paenibacillus shirakamiensis]|uniref:Copper amine oxidase-like N-terminal domain-containing protein n=1 Tax=Paenibacillus shirakamiensis TaxID=1265935 RepID=A0ABS4JFY7_9BACL|nr:stalk domain-containing protein [Paenibacillus shirakamiensis]MBP2000618.1 hypothetical protein [Paenibacillus shirakamiensis]